MIQLSDWARDLLISRGALVEGEGEGVVRALVPPDVSAKLSVSDWLSLDFGARSGANDPAEWMDRLSALLPPSPAVAGVRLRMRAPTGRIDADAILNRELVVQNGVWRLLEDYAGASPYYLFSFQHTVESDERTIGYAGVCLNGATRSLAEQPERLLRSVRDDLEDDPAFAVPAAELRALYPLAARAAEAEVRARIAFIEQSANRRLARDCERMESYYGGLLAQLEKRAARRTAEPQAAEKDRGRIQATQLDRAAKLEDLVRKYSLRVQLELTDVLIVSLPVRTIFRPAHPQKSGAASDARLERNPARPRHAALRSLLRPRPPAVSLRRQSPPALRQLLEPVPCLRPRLLPRVPAKM